MQPDYLVYKRGKTELAGINHSYDQRVKLKKTTNKEANKKTRTETKTSCSTQIPANANAAIFTSHSGRMAQRNQRSFTFLRLVSDILIGLLGHQYQARNQIY
jgi:hypothetical protein